MPRLSTSPSFCPVLQCVAVYCKVFPRYYALMSGYCTSKLPRHAVLYTHTYAHTPTYVNLHSHKHSRKHECTLHITTTGLSSRGEIHSPLQTLTGGKKDSFSPRVSVCKGECISSRVDRPVVVRCNVHSCLRLCL